MIWVAVDAMGGDQARNVEGAGGGARGLGVVPSAGSRVVESFGATLSWTGIAPVDAPDVVAMTESPAAARCAQAARVDPDRGLVTSRAASGALFSAAHWRDGDGGTRRVRDAGRGMSGAGATIPTNRPGVLLDVGASVGAGAAPAAVCGDGPRSARVALGTRHHGSAAVDR
jgi:hypothetical protein